MARKIENTLYKIKYEYGYGTDFVECENIEDLFRYIAEQIVDDKRVLRGVNLIDYYGDTPRVKIHTDKQFQNILKDKQTYPNLFSARDFYELKNHYSEDQLHDFEVAINNYEQTGYSENAYERESTFGYGDVLNWWDGMITTEDLFKIFEEV